MTAALSLSLGGKFYTADFFSPSLTKEKWFSAGRQSEDDKHHISYWMWIQNITVNGICHMWMPDVKCVIIHSSSAISFMFSSSCIAEDYASMFKTHLVLSLCVCTGNWLSRKNKAANQPLGQTVFFPAQQQKEAMPPYRGIPHPICTSSAPLCSKHISKVNALPWANRGSSPSGNLKLRGDLGATEWYGITACSPTLSSCCAF